MENQDFEQKIEEGIQYAKASEHLVQKGNIELKLLLEENLKLTKENQIDLKKIRKYMFWRMIISIIWILLIIIPLAAAVWFLPSFIKDSLSGYSSLLNDAKSSNELINQLNNLVK